MNKDRFKYKILDIENKEFVEQDYGDGYSSEYGEFLTLGTDGKIYMFWFSEGTHGDQDGGGFYSVDDEYKAVFSTGLRDKNGKLIFEGDVIKHKQGVDEVKWNQDGWFVGNYTPGNLSNFLNCEILGNIYENPELLTKE